MLNRRHLLIGSAATMVAGCQAVPQQQVVLPQRVVYRSQIPERYALMYRGLPDERFPVPAAQLTQVKPIFWRREVDNTTGERPGTIIVDTNQFFLFLTMPGGKAMRYGVGLGRQGFEWKGDAIIRRKAAWPTWTPPAEMIAREPDLEKYRNGMKPGLSNPLGARALYLYQGRVDTLYRLHGTAEAYSIGNAVSSGCVRLLNQDIIDLYNRTPVGTRVVVRDPSNPVPGQRGVV